MSGPPDPTLALYESISNWGRWGTDDQRGTLNLVTPDVVRAATATVTEGRSFGCGVVDEVPSPANPEPPQHHMLAAGDIAGDGYGMAVDYIGLAPHGSSTTHIDALCHVFFDGRMYNGRPASLVRSTGAEANSMSVLADGLVTRGVLLDIPRVRGVPYLEPADAVTAAELTAAAELAGVRPQAGDAVIVRVGREARRRVHGIAGERTAEGARHLAGLAADCLPWLRDHDISLLASDGGNDALPSPHTRERLPIHVGCLVFLGLHLIDNMALEPLTAACRDLGRYEFLFTVAPLVFSRATGSPVNPLAIL